MHQYDFFYDGQIRRFLLQVVRAFSGFQYQVNGENGKELRLVPCRMTTQSRQVAHILAGDTENSLASLPLITVTLKELSVDRTRTQSPGLVTSVHASERKVGDDGYTSEPGNKVTIERIMPHPINMKVHVEVWTTNEMQKHQLWEQIFMTFNTAFNIQSSDNPLDWTALTTMELEDVVWSGRSLPSSGGSDEIIDSCAFVFTLPIWISPPAKMKRQKLIHKVITNISHGRAESFQNPDVDGYFDSYDVPDRPDITFVETHENAVLSLRGNLVCLMNEEGVPLNWDEYLNKHGYSMDNVIIHFKGDDNDPRKEVQAIMRPTEESYVSELVFLSETILSPTLIAVNGIVDPFKPGVIDLFLNPEEGTRYIITRDVGTSESLKSLKAKANDIVEFRGGEWVVDFVAAKSDYALVVNYATNKLLKFKDSTWLLAIDGDYPPGSWRMRAKNF